MGTYKTKLLHNFHELNRRQQIRYFLIDRFRFNREERFFFEGCRGNPGQMFLAERQQLFRTIINKQPAHCFEVGTFRGGGSTYFLASAFARLGRGIVFTIETEKEFYGYARKYYEKKLPKLLPFIRFIHGSDIEQFSTYLKSKTLECFFLDGAENEDETVAQYHFFEKYLQQGTIMMAHDWNTEKMNKLKPLLLKKGSRWKLEMLLDPPKSVGFAVLVYQG